jgi:hypothetical protein
MDSPYEFYICSLRSDVALPKLSGYMTELAELRSLSPVCLNIRAHPLSDADIAVFLELTSVHLAEIAADVSCHLALKYGRARAVILSDEDHPFAIAARRAIPSALWGCACGNVAFIYGSSDKHVIWHESLHLMGAVDCYDADNPEADPGPNCERLNCIMQYVPDSSTVGQWPFLCERNLALLRAQMQALPR